MRDNIMRLLIPFWGLWVSIGVIGGCAPGKAVSKPSEATPVVMEKVLPGEWPLLEDDIAYDSLGRAINESLVYLGKLDPEKEWAFGEEAYTATHVMESLRRFAAYIATEPDTESLQKWLETHYVLYRAGGRFTDGRVLFTGYYEPFLKGRLKKDTIFRYPVYALPKDLVRVDLGLFDKKWAGQNITGRMVNNQFLPYPDRRTIDQENALQGATDVLAWVDDPVDLFFLHIQGSGRIYLADGRSINVHYHGANGHPYRSIGRYLIDQGKIAREKMSMQAIRNYLAAHPDEVETILHINPSYVFFKLEENGPLGNLGRPLTPGRSIALDRRIFPPAVLGFAVTEQPLLDAVGKIVRWVPMKRFVMNQDTGGAMRGPGRADLFWGHGPYAEQAAGHFKQMGDLYFLVLKP